MAHDIFISYSSKDKTIADAVCAKLEEIKIRVWIAPRDVPAGANFAGSIVEAINTCKVFILIWTANANASEHILNEINQAFEKGITIIPFRIQNIEPTDSMRYYIGRTHWLDAMTPPLEKHIETLADTIYALLGRKKAIMPEISPEKEGEETITTRRGLKKEKESIGPQKKVPMMLIVGVLIMVAAISGFILANQGRFSPPVSSANPALPLQTYQKIKACLATDANINLSYNNSMAWAGLEKARDDFGTEIKSLEKVTDYDASLQECQDWGADVIFAVGSQFSEPLSKAANANPKIKYAGIDTIGSSLDNLLISNFSIGEGTFLAGYLAAGMTKTGKVGTFTAFIHPDTQKFMDGFARGIDYYNLANGSNVKLLGYDPAKPELSYLTNDWVNDSPTREITKILLSEDADIILPIVPVALSIAVLETLKEGKEEGLMIGVDQNWSITNPEDSQYILASVVKNMDEFVIYVIESILQGTWESNSGTIFTLEQDLITLEYSSYWKDRIDFNLKATLSELVKGILAGSISPLPE